ncbi:MAG: hypothetical protein BWZ10_01480 [candidate division BRC1 bacterium ADurb.BinA364]|nr:MAG: hypothetical protein BWZ10_01480 [candidate division BRC1 bacterium ADurb.BinA364]
MRAILFAWPQNEQFMKRTLPVFVSPTTICAGLLFSRSTRARPSMFILRAARPGTSPIGPATNSPLVIEMPWNFAASMRTATWARSAPMPRKLPLGPLLSP